MTPISAPPGDLFWRYSVPKHRNRKVLLRTIGGVAIVGNWDGELNQYYVAWCPLPKSGKPIFSC